MKSFVPCDPGCDFPIQNLPYGVFSTPANVRVLIICLFIKLFIENCINNIYILVISRKMLYC